jgi:antitoxin (DNA-binding transcriptional repressor) of toxin-antitoxin stability system
MKIVDASRVRGSFASVLDAVRSRDEVVVIVRYHQPIAALVPVGRLTPRERRALFEAIGSDGTGSGPSVRAQSRDSKRSSS